MLKLFHLAVAALLIPWTASQSLVGEDIPAPSHSEENPCAADCSQEYARPVCGTDGRTYQSRCELNRQICEGSAVQLKHRGPCTEESRCLLERNLAEKTARRQQSQTNFIPECTEDGSYALVQCHPPTGYCWCATETGKPVPGTSVKNRKPKCGKRPPWKKGKKECSQVDRANFNENLLKLFLSEYNRLNPSSTPTAKDHALLDSRGKKAIDWKFTELDRNGDNFLDQKELKALKRMLMKIVRPKPCARTFTRSCDQNQDNRISRNEWSICLGVGINISFQFFLYLNSDEQTECSEKEKTQGVSKSTAPGITGWNRQFTTLTAQVRPTDTNIDETEEDMKDCATERRSALQDQNTLFVPECTPEGTYATVQCVASKGFCWCVNTETGRPISDKWAKNSKPDCSKETTSKPPANKDTAPTKPLKGCPDKKKTGFVNNLIEYILNEYLSANKSNSAKPVTVLLETKINSARWKFQIMDSNSNQVIDKKEWKEFKNGIKKKKNLRKCGRNFLKYCDNNNDKKVTSDEWLLCLGLKEHPLRILHD